MPFVNSLFPISWAYGFAAIVLATSAMPLPPILFFVVLVLILCGEGFLDFLLALAAACLLPILFFILFPVHLWKKVGPLAFFVAAAFLANFLACFLLPIELSQAGTFLFFAFCLVCFAKVIFVGSSDLLPRSSTVHVNLFGSASSN